MTCSTYGPSVKNDAEIDEFIDGKTVARHGRRGRLFNEFEIAFCALEKYKNGPK